jgi:predicted glycosyltransferase
MSERRYDDNQGGHMNGSPRRVLFYVQHLLGIGHIRRASLIVKAMAAEGLDVTLVSGGEPLATMDIGSARLIQLAPVKAGDARFSVLVDELGQPIDDAWKAARRARLLQVFAEVAPHVLLLEMYPFGRRKMSFELLPLLDAAQAARPRPCIATSVRDILVRKDKAARNAEMAAIAERYLDLVLVHGDPSLVPFEATFLEAARISERLRYTGYVVPDFAGPRGPDAPGYGEVIVSTGSGAVGPPLLQAVIDARRLTSLRDRTWRLITGPNFPRDAEAALAATAPAGVVVERFRDDFLTLLANCVLSISRAGYNTVMDLIRTRARAVVIPFDEDEETEQALRARLLAERGVVHVVPAADLTPARIAAAVEAALAGPPPAELGLDADGARRTAVLVRQAAERVA